MDKNDIKKVGLRATAPRIRILQILENHPQHHLSADEIFKILTDSGEPVGLATIYRVLTQFEAAGILTRSNFYDQVSVYEITSPTHHDHMVCNDTGEVMEFSDDLIERRQHEICAAMNLELIDHKMVLFVRKLKQRDASE